jgi:predicted nucleic acid-binding protein
MLLGKGEVVYFTLQNIAEFWNVATRPAANNGMGFSASIALREVETIERFLTVLPDSPAVYSEWKRLITRHAVLGSKVHDARLVATMNVHGIRKILTFNIEDFARYDLDAIHPASLLATQG